MKTFYSVTYTVLGADRTEKAWFESKEEATAFSDRDYYNTPIAHHYKNQETIAKYNELIKFTRNFR